MTVQSRLVCAALLIPAAAAAQSRSYPPLVNAEIDAAIKRGIAYLKKLGTETSVSRFKLDPSKTKGQDND